MLPRPPAFLKNAEKHNRAWEIIAWIIIVIITGVVGPLRLLSKDYVGGITFIIGGLAIMAYFLLTSKKQKKKIT